MLREPKTDRPLGLATVGAAYTVLAIAGPGNTLTPPAYANIREIFATEHQFLVAAIVVLIVQIVALASHGLLRLLTCLFVTITSVAFGLLVFRSTPSALLPGFAIVIAICNVLALFDSFRLHWHKA